MHNISGVQEINILLSRSILKTQFKGAPGRLLVFVKNEILAHLHLFNECAHLLCAKKWKKNVSLSIT